MVKLKEKGIYQLLILMIFVLLLLSMTTIIIIHRTVFNSKKILLQELCETQKDIIQSVYNETNEVNTVLDVLYKQQKRANLIENIYEFSIASSRNDSIIFLVRMRNNVQDNYLAIPLKSDIAIPMQYALSKKNGFIHGADYNGNQVLAYCTYIPELQWGIVTKMDEQEVAMPFYKAGFYAILSSIFLILISTIIFRKISLPIARKIEESVEYYRRLFEFSSIPIWKEDYSEIKKHFDKLKDSGITDFKTYFEANIEEVKYLKSLIKIVEINRISIEFFGAKSKEEVINNMPFYFNDYSYNIFKEELIVLAEGGKQFECEMPIKTISGNIKTLHINLSVVSGSEDTLSNILISFIDLTERKNYEESLIRSQAEWVETFDLIPDLITILDNKQRIVRANKAAKEKLGILQNETLNMHCYQCIHGKPESPSFCPHSLMLKDGKEHIADFHEEKLGMDMLVSVTPIKDCKGNITGSVHISRDITERRKKEKELQKLNRTLSALGKSSHEMMRARDEMLYLNEVCNIIVNYCGYAMVWIGYAENDKEKSVNPVAYSGFEEGYIDTLKITWSNTERGNGPTGTAIRTAKPALCKDMINAPEFKPWRDDALKRGYASSVVFPLISDNKAFGAINIYSKIADSFSNEEIELLSELANDLAYGIISIRSRIAQKIAEEALIKSEEKYRLLFNEMIDGFAFHQIILNNDGIPCDYKFLSVNPAFEKLTGLKASEIIDKTVLEVMPDTEIFWIEKYGEVALSGKSIEFENYHSTLDKYFKVSSFSPQKGFFAVIFEDVTVRKNTEKEILERDEKLQKYAEELKESIDTKDKFFKIIAHDLKNPFISLIGASELLYENADKYDNTKIVKLAKILNDSAKNGYDMLLNLLEWARSQAGSMMFQPEKINLKKLTNNYSNLIEYSISKKINLKFNIADDIYLIADKNMLDTILRNLIGNSLKFTPKGGEVTISTINKNDTIIIYVKDNGVGIEKCDFDKLFRTDIRYSNQGTDQEGGTGLGLILCKEFVEKHGGQIWVESEANKGCTFYFTLCN